MSNNLKPLVNNKELYDSFKNEINTQILMYSRSLEQASTLVDVHRLQGSINALRRLLQLKEQVNGSEPSNTTK
tara:strand:+ start:443 stop:661 length:219 start_codon:yes stop_codon:yes gene_type:complete